MNATPRPGAWTAPTFSFRFDPLSLADLDAQVRDAMRKAGIEPPDSLQLDGEVHRFSTKQGRHKDDGGVYQIHPDGIPAGWFQDHRTTGVIHFRADIGRKLTPIEEAAYRRRLEDMKAARQAEQAKKRARAADLTRQLWSASRAEDGSHPYRIAPGIPWPNSIRVIDDTDAARILGYQPEASGVTLTGPLLIALATDAGEVTTAELIDPAGHKSAVYGGRKAGAAVALELVPPDAECIVIAEGIRTAAAILAAVPDCYALAALSCGNLPAIAGQMREAHPAARLIVAADLDKTTRQPDAHAVRAARESGATLAVPDVTADQGKDFHDVFTAKGPEAVRAAILGAPEPEPGPESFDPVRAAEALRIAITEVETLPPLAREIALGRIAKEFTGNRSADSLRRLLESAEKAGRRTWPKPPESFAALTLNPSEREAAALSPAVIVEDYLFADVGLLSAPGGVGKTTLILWEAVHVALGLPLYGLPVRTPGPVLIVTAEDGRSLLAARLHRILRDLGLTPEQMAEVDKRLAIWDVSGDLSRLVDTDAAGRLTPTGMADAIVTAAKTLAPVLVILDPVVSFGATENRVNDGEQAVITECRRIVRGLGCCVRLVTHTGQAAARSGSLDQYSSRGGSALSDGARMVSVLAAWKPSDSDTPPPTLHMAPGASVIRLARPKLSFCGPQPLIWIARDGFRFDWALAAPAQTPEQQTSTHADQLEKFLLSELATDRRYTRNSLEQAKHRLGMNRDPLRRALAELEVSRRIVEQPLPACEQHGRRKTYLHPTRAIARELPAN